MIFGEFDSELLRLIQREVATACAGKKIGSRQEKIALSLSVLTVGLSYVVTPDHSTSSSLESPTDAGE